MKTDHQEMIASTLCACCGENEVWEDAFARGWQWCEECSHTDECGNQYHRDGEDADTHLVWEDDPDVCFCDKCRRAVVTERETDVMKAEVRDLAALNGWEIEREQQAETGSFYLSLFRQCDVCIRGDDGVRDTLECTCEKLKVRISDHGSCYCREDVSLVIPSGNPSGDDHAIGYLEARLNAQRKNDICGGS